MFKYTLGNIYQLLCIVIFQHLKLLQASPHFFVDAYYIHEVPSPENKCEVSKYSIYITEIIYNKHVLII